MPRIDYGSGARDLTLGVIGEYFTGITPTPGTGIIGHAAPTTFDETKPYLLVFNGSDSGKILYPLYLRLTTTVAGAGNAIVRFTQAIDKGNRFSSGGTALTLNNTNMLSNAGTGATATVGAVVASAATAARRVISNQTYRTVLGVVGDVYQFSWACPEANDPAGLITTGSAVSNVAFGFAAVAIGPGQSFMVHQWAASQSTGPTFEVEFGYCELPVE